MKTLKREVEAIVTLYRMGKANFTEGDDHSTVFVNVKV